MSILHRVGKNDKNEISINKAGDFIEDEVLYKIENMCNTHEYVSNMTLYNYDDFFIKNSKYKHEYEIEFSMKLYFLKYINEQKVKNLYIIDERFLLLCIDLRRYFKYINISFYMIDEIECQNVALLSYVDNIFCSKVEYIEYLNGVGVVINKQNVDLIRVITFGTYDLFHIGHTNILKRAKTHGSQLVVGVSTDELNKKKGKTSINNLDKRKLDVFESGYADIIFDEESLEYKNEYVKKYNCNLLIMGDDWKDGFNFCDCACIYLPRTPDISTTMLKEKLGK
jgi:choline-phosphate cytidylyltransferase/glycerol-3-phosphate cytidylyltransferase